jgi:hypothetical protein
VQAGVLALALVSGLLWLVLRSVREVAFTLAPVVLSGFLTLGSCVVIGQALNFANIIAFPLLFGVGVAFHIYFVMAWRRGVSGLLQTSLARAVFTSALATGTAFGALCLSHHPGTASMGLILMIALVWTLVCALIFEPALGPGDARRPRRKSRNEPRKAAAGRDPRCGAARRGAVDQLADLLGELLGGPKFAMLVVPNHWGEAPLAPIPPIRPPSRLGRSGRGNVRARLVPQGSGAASWHGRLQGQAHDRQRGRVSGPYPPGGRPAHGRWAQAGGGHHRARGGRLYRPAWLYGPGRWRRWRRQASRW